MIPGTTPTFILTLKNADGYLALRRLVLADRQLQYM